MNEERWQLPDGVDELLPHAAWQVERLRRRIIDCCHGWGFDLVMPPMIEYLDSLLTGTGETMDLQTFKLVDQQNGRTMGIRADMTPQVARMDAHALRQDLPNRLFYIGSVLRARTDGFGGSRSPLQFGAELFGHAGVQSDIEIIRLMLATIKEADINPDNLVLDLGHVGVYRSLVSDFDLSDHEAESLFQSVQRGSLPDVVQLFEGDDDLRKQQCGARIAELMNLRGDASVIVEAKRVLADANADCKAALDSLEAVVAGVKRIHPGIRIHIDLAELRGYSYHTGVLFSAYTQQGTALAHGGRYDAVGAAFGHPRPATGFSGDLKKLADAGFANSETQTIVFVPHDSVDEAWEEIVRLRADGRRVITGLDREDSTLQADQCSHCLVRQNDQWVLRESSSDSSASRD